MRTIRKLSAVVLLLGSPLGALAQQNVPPRADVPVKPAFKPAIEAAKVKPLATQRMNLVGREQDLFTDLALTPLQREQLKRNLGQLACLPEGAQVPGGMVVMQQTMQQTMQPINLNPNSTSPVDPCMTDAIDVVLLKNFRDHITTQLKARNRNVTAFESSIPEKCALKQVNYYLQVLATL